MESQLRSLYAAVVGSSTGGAGEAPCIQPRSRSALLSSCAPWLNFKSVTHSPTERECTEDAFRDLVLRLQQQRGAVISTGAASGTCVSSALAKHSRTTKSGGRVLTFKGFKKAMRELQLGTEGGCIAAVLKDVESKRFCTPSYGSGTTSEGDDLVGKWQPWMGTLTQVLQMLRRGRASNSSSHLIAQSPSEEGSDLGGWSHVPDAATGLPISSCELSLLMVELKHGIARMLDNNRALESRMEALERYQARRGADHHGRSGGGCSSGSLSSSGRSNELLKSSIENRQMCALERRLAQMEGLLASVVDVMPAVAATAVLQQHHSSHAYSPAAPHLGPAGFLPELQEGVMLPPAASAARAPEIESSPDDAASALYGSMSDNDEGGATGNALPAAALRPLRRSGSSGGSHAASRMAPPASRSAAGVRALRSRLTGPLSPFDAAAAACSRPPSVARPRVSSLVGSSPRHESPLPSDCTALASFVEAGCFSSNDSCSSRDSGVRDSSNDSSDEPLPEVALLEKQGAAQHCSAAAAGDAGPPMPCRSSPSSPSPSDAPACQPCPRPSGRSSGSALHLAASTSLAAADQVEVEEAGAAVVTPSTRPESTEWRTQTRTHHRVALSVAAVMGLHEAHHACGDNDMVLRL